MSGLWRLARAVARSAGALRPVLLHVGASLRSAGLDCRVSVRGTGVARIGQNTRSGLLSRLLRLGSVNLLWGGLVRALLTGRARA
jgi:hypothetical protein